MAKKMLGNTKSISGGGFSSAKPAPSGVGTTSNPRGMKALGSIKAGTGFGDGSKKC